MKKLLIFVVAIFVFSFFGSDTITHADNLEPLDVITVDTTLDDLSKQACTSSPNDCSLRGAISKSNATTSGIGTIVIPAGIYELSLTGIGETLNATGDLNINKPVILQGAGVGSTFIQAGPSKGNGIDRVLRIAVIGNVCIKDLTIRWGTISTGSEGGGGIYYFGVGDFQLVLERVTVHENTLNISDRGGGIFMDGDLIVRDSVITNNSTNTGEGGGIYQSLGSLTIERTTISGNSANYGGGIAVNRDAIFNNVTISGNYAGYDVDGVGGGINQWNTADLTMYNSTVTGNTLMNAITYGWAIYDVLNFKSYNSIITAQSGKSACTYGMDSGDHNIISDSSCTGTGGATVIDPLLGPLADNGGITLTHALLTGSPAIDAGDNATCELIDQRGNNRLIDGDQDGTATCDIGAFEFGWGLYLPLIIR